MLVRLDNEVKSFKQELFRLAWFMRGGVNINDLFWRYSFEDREMIRKVIEDNVELTKKTQMPII